MIDGTMCPCGEFIDGGADGPGFPQYCSDQCEEDYGAGKIDNSEFIQVERPAKTVACPLGTCEKKFQDRYAAAQHWVDKHG